MEDPRTIIDTGKIATITAAGNGAKLEGPTHSRQAGDDDDDDEREILEALLKKGTRQMFPRNMKRLRAYGSALTGGFAIVPTFALALTVALYLVTSSLASWIPVLLGIAATCILWLILSIPMSFLTAPDKVNTRSYGLLVSRLSQLETRLLVIQTQKQKLKLYQRIALEEAFTNFQELDAMLYESTARLPWVLGLGYVVAWFKIHRAEEALMEVEPKEMVVREAYHDYLAISDSYIRKSDEMLDRLHKAVKTLDPGMADTVPSSIYLADMVEELKAIEGQIQNIPQQHGTNHENKQDNQAKPAHEQSTDARDDEANARVTIRVIRRALNEYRDLLWGNLIRARNRLMGGIFITGFTTYVLLCITLLSVSPVNGNADGERSAILAAAVYYLVGAIAGLFGVIYRESTTRTSSSTDADDYGLTLARLIGTPLLSGLAGIGGVLVLQIASSTATNASLSSTLTLSSIFTINRLDYLIAAALFGYAPSMIVRNLQQRTSKYLSGLQSSKASDTGDSDS
jgi:hypothetical protein